MRRLSTILWLAICCTAAALAQTKEDTAKPAPAGAEQTAAPQPAEAGAANGFKRVEEPPAGAYLVQSGTRILLNMINSVSTRQAAVGDRIYLETAYPILSNGKVVIPQGSWVQGTVTQVKRPGRVKGRGELYVRFDSLTLPNGVTRDFRARIGQMDGRSTEDVDRNEGKIKAQGNKKGDAVTVAETTAAGAGLGSIAGAASGSYGMGAGIGGAAGAATGLAAVLLSRGPDATLTRGTTMEMVLDRTLTFHDSELDFSHVAPRAALADGTGPQQPQQNNGRRWPF